MMVVRINPLQLPDPIRDSPVNWAQLGQIGDSIGAGRQKQAVADAIAQATGPDGRLDAGLAASKLASMGMVDEARNFQSIVSQQQSLGLQQQRFQYEVGQDRLKQENERRAIEAIEGGPGPQSGANGGAQSDSNGGAVKGSWYSQHQGNSNWVDRQDRPGSNALGVPDSQQGIARPTRQTLGQWFDVTGPDGKTYRLQQTDVGPAKWTGRGVDISAAAADKMGYTPGNFPTDGRFTVRRAEGPPQAQPVAPAPQQMAQAAQPEAEPLNARDATIARYTAALENPGLQLSPTARKAYETRLERLVKEKAAENKAQAPDATLETNLRKEFEGVAKPHLDVRRAYSRVQEAGDTAAGDISLIYGFMRMQDPTSTVREGEFATAQNAAGIPDRIRNIYNRAIEGTRLTPGQRTDFKGQAGKLYGASKNEYDARSQQFRVLSKRYGADPDRVIPELGDEPSTIPAPQPGVPQPAPSGAPQPTPGAVSAAPAMDDKWLARFKANPAAAIKYAEKALRENAPREQVRELLMQIDPALAKRMGL